MEKNILVISPLRNEIDNLGRNVLKINKYFNYLVIDDNSNDGSRLFLKKHGIKFIRNSKPLGYEKTIIKGLKFGLKNNFKAIVTIDSDGEHLFTDLKKIIKIYKKKNYDLIIGNRKNITRPIEKIFCYFFNKKYKSMDPLCGLKLYKVKILKKIDFKIIKKFFLIDLLIFFFNRKITYKNLSINSGKRKGISKVGGIIYVNIKIFLMTLKLLFNKF